MKILPKLGGGKWGDPSLYIDIVDRKRGILFDCGQNNFRHAQLRKVTDVFISHTHIDHFIGFDTLLRLNLTEDKTLNVYGPPGITRNVIGKLQAYTWNICQNLSLVIMTHEILPEKIVSTELPSWQAFASQGTTERPSNLTLLDTGEFSVRYLELDHKIPSFGYAFKEAESCNVRKDVMHSMGFPPGPWVAQLKSLTFRPEHHDTMLSIEGRSYSVEFLTEHLLVRKPGVKITYLTDFIFDDALQNDFSRFAWQSDVLFCESAFSEQEREKARHTHHLTAKQAATLARTANVKQLVLFHFSKRYQDSSVLLDEAREIFPAVE